MASTEDVILGPAVDDDNEGEDSVLELSPDDFAEEDNSDQPDEQAAREGGYRAPRA